MIKTKSNLKILGLEGKEKSIIKTLKDFGQMRPIDLANKTGVKRTTINFLLKKLLVRGLVKKIKVKGHYEWLLNDEDKIKQSISELFDYFNAKDIAGTIYLPPDIGVEVFKGKKNILAAYNKAVLRTGYNSRVFVIQGNKSTAISQKLETSYINSIQSKFRKNKIILEGVIGEKTLASFQTLSVNMLKIYKNRLVVCYVVDDSIIDFDMDILIFQKTVMMINFEKNLVLIIKNENIYKAIYSLFKAMEFAGRKIDLNAYINDLIIAGGSLELRSKGS